MYSKLKTLFFVIFFILPTITFGQFVDEPEVSAPANAPAIESNLQINNIFDVFIIISAFLFIISLLGFIMAIIKMTTSGGDEMTAETAVNISILSGWIFGASILIFLFVNIIKYFIY